MISRDIQKAVDLLQQNELVAIPTETVYGLAGNMYSEQAILKIFELKQRPFFNPLIVHIHHIGQLQDLSSHIPQKAHLLMEAFWPGSLTLILKKTKDVSDLITAGKDTVAVRMPDHPITLDLLKRLAFPLAAPSANPFGSISPTKAIHVEEYFGDRLPMVLDGGDCMNGLESTIVGFENDEPIVYRLGAISVEHIQSVVGPIKIKNKEEASPDAPGMLSRHYAPQTTTYLMSNVEEGIRMFPGKRIGLLLFAPKDHLPDVFYTEVLSERNDLSEAAANLYSAMHALDKMNLDVIIAERFPDVALGKTINDRLERATKK